MSASVQNSTATGTRLTEPTAGVPRVLSIAGTDPTGGAGIQADLKSIAAAGGYGMAVVTALVAQNTRGVRSVQMPGPDFLREQLDSVSDDVEIDAVKIGMLGDVDTIAEVSTWLDRVHPPLVVLDPVLVATSGDRLLSSDAEAALRELCAGVDVIAPNIAELAVLAGTEPATDLDAAKKQATRFAERVGTTVIVKTGHLTGSEAGNGLVTPDGRSHFVSSTRMETTSTHGTGCSLSAALATRMRIDPDTPAALGWVTSWLHEAIRHGEELAVGQGYGPVDHFHRARRLEQAANTTPWRHLRGPLPDGENPDDMVVPSPVAAPTPRVSAAGPWTAALWDASGELLHRTMELPFITGLGAGTLTEQAFTFYLDQDAQYLSAYARALASLSVTAPTAEAQVSWAMASAECITVEQELHRTWLTDREVESAPSPVTSSYTDFLRQSTLGQDHVIGAAAVLPCFWLYAEVGLALADRNSAGHPYSAWLSTYADQGFLEGTATAIAHVEKAFEGASPAQRAHAARAFLTASAHELEFFDQADRAW